MTLCLSYEFGYCLCRLDSYSEYEQVLQSVTAIQTSDSARKVEELQPWDGEQRIVSKYVLIC